MYTCFRDQSDMVATQNHKPQYVQGEQTNKLELLVQQNI